MALTLKPDFVTPSPADQPRTDSANNRPSLVIYVAGHCPNCAYAETVADWVRRDFPQVQLHVVDVETTREPIPETVFATPTYVLNNRVWSLGNPSFQQVTTTLQKLLAI